MDPPPALFIAGTAHFVPRNTPVEFTDIVRSQSSRVSSSSGCLNETPALFTRMSSLPNLRSAASTADFQSRSLVTSRWTYIAVPPLEMISASTLRPFSSRMSPNTTEQPSLANSLASHSP